MSSKSMRERIEQLTARLGLRPDARDELADFAREVIAASQPGDDDMTVTDLPVRHSSMSTEQPEDEAGEGELLMPAPAPADTQVMAPRSAPAPRPPGANALLTEFETTGPKLNRYADLGLLARGGMSEVRRALDPVLGRTLALKLLPAHASGHQRQADRFIEEARITSQLQHPGVAPVYELGSLEDGRLFFTMQEIRGRTLSAVIREAHTRSSEGAWSLRRLVGALHAVCETVAYAHSRGVIHGDLKPANIMIGDFGEVYVVDWGLARQLDPSELKAGTFETAGARVDLAGTPAYMPPEQARGEPAALSPTRDVYALGAVLFQILSGTRPYTGDTTPEVLQRVVEGKREPLEGALGVPDELRVLCNRAMAQDPADRYPNAAALAVEIDAWLEGVRRREQALALVTRSDRLPEEARSRRAEAAALRAEARTMLAPVPPWAPVAEKQAGWDREDEADARVQEAELLELQFVQELQAALNLVPDLPEAHDRLARHYQAAHADALARRDAHAAATAEALLRAHDGGQFQDWLMGDGLLTLVTDPPGADVVLHRSALRGRRLVSGEALSLGRTPLTDVPLPAGSYLCTLSAPGRHPLRYPVLIERTARWDSVCPGEQTPTPVVLPPEGSVRDDEVVVPAGWFWSGGDAEAPNSLPSRRVWLDAFAIQRHPVTNADYIEFLNDLVREDRTREALAHAPRERGGAFGQQGALIIGYTPGEPAPFHLGLDADGDPWLPDVPVCMISWDAAGAYAAWWAARTGLPWRLPRELEWEKAARGVDGRFFPWGDVLDPTWCAMRESHPGRPRPARIAQFPEDESPYGVRGLGGNMRDWCADRWHRDGPTVIGGLALAGDYASPADTTTPGSRVVRGGAWGVTDRFCRSAFRYRAEPGYRNDGLGFRLVRSLLEAP